MERVAVVGSGGAGKSTFSDELGRRTGLPVIHLDQHHWHPGWVPTPRAEWREVVSHLVTGDRWIIDGNYGGTLDVRLAHADTVIVLALSRWRCTARVLLRWWRARGRAVQAPGCPERIDRDFLRWVWRYPVDARPRLDAALAAHRSLLHIVELTAPAAVAAYLDGVGPSS